MSSFLINILITGSVTLITTILTLYFLIPYLKKKAFLDIPNERSSHTKVTPRGGGLGLLAGVIAGSITAFVLALPVPHYTFFIGLALMAGTSFADDRKSLPVIVRLSAHILAMGLVIWYTGGLKRLPFPGPLDFELGYFGFIISAIWIVSVINFFNFLDGIDGFAGSQAMIAGIALSIITWGGSVSVISTTIAIAAFGFLLYNWHPAKVFMGDVGSITLGFAFATLPFYSGNFKIEESVFSTAIFIWFFLADGAFTLIRRLLNKERIWEAHRSHLYQRLNKSGWPHHKIVCTVMSMAVCLIGIQVYFFKTNQAINWISILSGAIFFVLYIFLVSSIENKKILN